MILAKFHRACPQTRPEIPRTRAQVRGGDRVTTDTTTLTGWVDAFLLDRRAGNCTASTIDTYRVHLERFAASGADVSALGVQRYLNGLRTRMKPISVHKHYRTLRAFFGWTVNLGVLDESPLRGFRMIAGDHRRRGPGLDREDRKRRHAPGYCQHRSRQPRPSTAIAAT